MASGKIALSESSYNLLIGTNGSLSADIDFNLPVSNGSANQVLTTDGVGNLSWATVTSETAIVPTDNFLKWDAVGNYYYPYTSKTAAGSTLSLYTESTLTPSTLATPSYLHINGVLVAGSTASSRIGISGYTSSGSAIKGTASTGTGLYGTSVSSYGVYGISSNGVGIFAQSSSNIGLYANTISNDAIASFAYNYSTKLNVLNTGQLEIVGEYTLPDTAGTSGYVLSSTGTGGTLSWVAQATGGVTPTDDILQWYSPTSIYRPYVSRSSVSTNLKFYTDNTYPIPNLNSTGTLTINGAFVAGSTNASYSKIGSSGYSYLSIGVYGQSYVGNGVYGQSFSANGIYGESTSGPGGSFISDSSYGVLGNSSTSYGGYFNTTSGSKIAGFAYNGTEILYITSTGTIRKDNNYIIMDSTGDVLLYRNSSQILGLKSSGVYVSSHYYLPNTAPIAGEFIQASSSSISAWSDYTLPTTVPTEDGMVPVVDIDGSSYWRKEYYHYDNISVLARGRYNIGDVNDGGSGISSTFNINYGRDSLTNNIVVLTSLVTYSSTWDANNDNVLMLTEPSANVYASTKLTGGIQSLSSNTQDLWVEYIVLHNNGAESPENNVNILDSNLRILTKGTYNFQLNGSNDQTVTISFSTVNTDKYIPIITFRQNDTETDPYAMSAVAVYVIYDKTATSFKVGIKNCINTSHYINIDYILFHNREEDTADRTYLSNTVIKKIADIQVCAEDQPAAIDGRAVLFGENLGTSSLYIYLNSVGTWAYSTAYMTYRMLYGDVYSLGFTLYGSPTSFSSYTEGSRHNVSIGYIAVEM